MLEDSPEIDQFEHYHRHDYHRHGRDSSQSGIMVAMVLVICMLVGLIAYLARDNITNPTATQPVIVNLDQPRNSSGDMLTGEIATGSVLQSGDVATGNVLTGSTGSTLIDPTQLARITKLMGSTDYLSKMVSPDSLQAATTQISLNPQDSKLESPSLQLQGTTDGSIQKITIAHLDSDGVLQSLYTLTKFKAGDDTRSTNITPNNGNIKPGPNRYFIIGTDADGINHVMTTVLTAPTGVAFDSEWTRRCLMDVCTDQNIKLTKQADGTYTQKTATREITFKPEQMISIRSLVNDELTTVKQIENNILVKTNTSSFEDSSIKNIRINQSIKTTYGEPINYLPGISYPKSIAYGNMSYVNPTLQFNSTTSHNFILQNDLKNKTPSDVLASYIKAIGAYGYGSIDPVLSLEVSENIYVQYALSRHQRNIFDPTAYDTATNKLTSFRVIPKVASWMKGRTAYAVIEPEMEQAIVEQVGRVEKQSNCNPKKYGMTDKPDVKFVLYPIDDQYDVVTTTNCWGVVRI